MRPFAQRPISSIGVTFHDDWALKRYTIVYGEQPVDWRGFEPGLALAVRSLPEPAVTAERLGVGFLIAHRGAGADYVVLGWWDRENELPLRVVVRDQTPGAEWRPARGSESVCVWDLQVIGFERDAYVTTVLAGGATGEDGGRRDAYLARHPVVPISAAGASSVTTGAPSATPA